MRDIGGFKLFGVRVSQRAQRIRKGREGNYEANIAFFAYPLRPLRYLQLLNLQILINTQFILSSASNNKLKIFLHGSQ